MYTTLDLLGNTHKYRRCTPHDIEIHSAVIQNEISVDEVAGLQQRMAQSVAEETAYTLVDHSCFIYYTITQPGLSQGVVLYGKNNPLKMIALFSGVFHHRDEKTFKMDFSLHPGKFVQEYKSLLTMTSIKRAIGTDRPLVVRVDFVKDKIKDLYLRRGMI